ncbi:MAG: ACT domain-containing protein [Clostridia bacterium]|nr:ACT domain-containing protein [Clostridia bacterium]
MGKFLLIDSKILPDVYTRVLEAKKLISDGVVKNATEAAKLAGVSRSAFYKYKDSVFDYNERYEGHIFTLHIILEDRAGVMMQFVNALYKLGANILTVYQDIPNGGRASLSVSFRAGLDDLNISDMVEMLKKVDGVVSVTQILG